MGVLPLDLALGLPPAGRVFRSAPARAGFVLAGGAWRAEKLEPFEFSLPYPNTFRPPDFWTPGRVFATRYAAHSALAFDRALHPVIAWAGDDRLRVSLLVGDAWSELDGAPAQGPIDGAPAIAASAHRICVAWTAATPILSTFVRCHRA